jgi:HD-GYP domain-containing protein (c-di-GMP phosphodiesterase class II)
VSVVPENGSAGNVEGGMWKDGDAMLRHLWQTVEDFLQKVRVSQQPDPHAVIKTADILIESLKRNDDLVKVLFVKKESGDLASRLIDVAIVAARIGFSLRYETGKLQELVLCALLHDVGMLKVPEGIVNKKGKLEDSELADIRRHPQYGQEILRAIPGLPLVVSEAAYQEQEREDGSGYPQGLRGDSIHEYAKIIGLAVLFTAMLQPRPQRARRIPFEIIKEIIDHNKAQFPLYLIRILIDELSLFPEGLYVTLNTGEIGRVLRTSRLAPMRPVIEIVRDVHGRQPREPREYDLMKEQILRIEDALFEIT